MKVTAPVASNTSSLRAKMDGCGDEGGADMGPASTMQWAATAAATHHTDDKLDEKCSSNGVTEGHALHTSKPKLLRFRLCYKVERTQSALFRNEPEMSSKRAPAVLEENGEAKRRRGAVSDAAPGTPAVPLGYQAGFGNHFATEALPGALPKGQNGPQVVRSAPCVRRRPSPPSWARGRAAL